MDTKIELSELQEDVDENPVSCPMCDNNDHQVLGILGKLLWLRCNACGWEFEKKMENLQ